MPQITEVPEKVLDAVKNRQDAVVKAVRTVSERLPEPPELPFSDWLPEPGEVVRRYFDYAEKLLANQRDFAIGLVEASRPAAKSPAKPKTKSA
ncbi:MAG: hypothetical protein ACRDZ1_14010 [Acidimicrobiia bacterium]